MSAMQFWDDSELGIFGFQDDTAYVGSPTVFEGIINVPTQINQDGDTLPVVALTDIEMVTLVPGLELDSVFGGCRRRKSGLRHH